MGTFYCDLKKRETNVRDRIDASLDNISGTLLVSRKLLTR